jgi:hypothetical protein
LPPLLDFESLGKRLTECFGAFLLIRATFFDVDLLAETLRLGFALRAAGLLATTFFFFDLGIIEGACRFRRQK